MRDGQGERNMGVNVRGVSDPHLHHPCPVCGYATRYKQWPSRCACSPPLDVTVLAGELCRYGDGGCLTHRSEKSS